MRDLPHTVPTDPQTRERLARFFGEAGIDAENVAIHLVHPGNINDWLLTASLSPRNSARAVLGAYVDAIETFDDMPPPLAEVRRCCLLCARQVELARLIVVAASDSARGTAAVAVPLCWGCYDTYGGTEKRVLRALRQRYRERILPDLRRLAAGGAP
jgi:hypothetical protein